MWEWERRERERVFVWGWRVVRMREAREWEWEWEGEWQRRESGESMWEWEGEWEWREVLRAERCLIRKNPIWNQVLETRFPGVFHVDQPPTTSLTTSHINRASNCRDTNRVSKTRFPNGRHVEKTPNQTWSIHGNRASKTRFISPKSSLLDSRC